MFNAILRSMMQTFLDNCIIMHMQLRELNAQDLNGMVDIFTAFLIMIFCVGFPVWSAKFLLLNREKV